MKLLILKTNIKTKKLITAVKPLFNKHINIINWSIDTDDIDNVLRIEAQENLSEIDIIQLINTNGLLCEALPD